MQLVDAELRVPYARMELVAAIRAAARVVHEEYGEASVVVSVKCTERALGRLRKRIAGEPRGAA